MGDINVIYRVPYDDRIRRILHGYSVSSTIDCISDLNRLMMIQYIERNIVEMVKWYGVNYVCDKSASELLSPHNLHLLIIAQKDDIIYINLLYLQIYLVLYDRLPIDIKQYLLGSFNNVRVYFMKPKSNIWICCPMGKERTKWFKVFTRSINKSIEIKRLCMTSVYLYHVKHIDINDVKTLALLNGIGDRNESEIVREFVKDSIDKLLEHVRKINHTTILKADMQILMYESYKKQQRYNKCKTYYLYLKQITNSAVILHDLLSSVICESI